MLGSGIIDHVGLASCCCRDVGDDDCTRCYTGGPGRNGCDGTGYDGRSRARVDNPARIDSTTGYDAHDRRRSCASER